MKKNKTILSLLALTMIVGALLFPVTALAQAGDTTPPTVTAEINGDMLKVTATDYTGVAAIFINESRFSTLINGTANVLLKDYAGNDAQITVYATDTAGNRSQPVMIDNPYYKPSAQTTPASNTYTPVQPTPEPFSIYTPAPVTPEPISEPGTPDSTSMLPEPQPPVMEDDEITPEETESVIPSGDNAFTPDGGGTVMDNATQQDGKEFFTVTATDGSVYYLIIDRQRGSENVYFLSAVTREDLLGLTESGTTTSPGLSQPEPQIPENTPQTEQPETEQPKQDGGGMGTIIFILFAVAIVGGAGYYFKIIKPRKEAAQMQNDEYEDEEPPYDEDDVNEDETYVDETDDAEHEYLSGADTWMEDGQ